MSIVSVNEIYPRSSSISGDERTYTRMYDVLSDVQDESEYMIRQATGLPKRSQIHPIDTSAVVTDVNFSQDANAPQLWHATVNYSTKVPVNITVNPLLRPPQYSYDTETETVPVKLAYKFLNGTGAYTSIEYRRSPFDSPDLEKLFVPVQTSAHELFDPGLQETVYYPIFNITRNEQNWTSLLAEQYLGSINSVPCNGHPAFTLLMSNITATLQRENFQDTEYVFWEVTYKIKVNADTHDWKINDNGSQRINFDTFPTYQDQFDNTTAVTNAGEINPDMPVKIITDRDRRTVRVNLNGFGEQHRRASDEVKNFYRVYRTKKERDFNLLNLF